MVHSCSLCRNTVRKPSSTGVSSSTNKTRFTARSSCAYGRLPRQFLPYSMFVFISTDACVCSRAHHLYNISTSCCTAPRSRCFAQALFSHFLHTEVLRSAPFTRLHSPPRVPTALGPLSHSLRCRR